ncbi:putative membrane protein [Thermoplasmatales archaeon SCGC AB-540-F20]|nr:putative membrane protein [Thermoplasmatales archaeon SCGC AB-540-F20]MCK4332024.1 DUF106 domain-containing protein [Thermoplasmatales archaeon]
MNDKAQGSQLLMLMLLMFVMIFIFGDPNIRSMIALSLNSVFYPIIGFGGNYPLLTIFLAGILVVFLSSFFTNLFTDWKAMGKAQEASRAFQKEINKARKEGNTNRVKKLMKMQPQIMKMTTESSSKMMKPMLFLFIFIAPIFIWIIHFLGNLEYYFFTVPWTTGVSLFDKVILMSNWFLVYLLISMVLGQLIRQGLKWISWSDWWQNIRKNIRPSVK